MDRVGVRVVGPVRAQVVDVIPDAERDALFAPMEVGAAVGEPPVRPGSRRSSGDGRGNADCSPSPQRSARRRLLTLAEAIALDDPSRDGFPSVRVGVGPHASLAWMQSSQRECRNWADMARASRLGCDMRPLLWSTR